MIRFMSIFTMCCALGLSACGGESSKSNDGAKAQKASAAKIDHLECAAQISARSYFERDGRLPNSERYDKLALATGGHHLNAYAIPLGLDEKTAYAQLNARRAEIVEKGDPEKVSQTAFDCIDQVEKLYR